MATRAGLAGRAARAIPGARVLKARVREEEMVETEENRLRRLRMRSWRRGTKEMDLILGPYADARLAELDTAALDLYEALLEENDQDLYLWISRGVDFPGEHGAVIGLVRRFHALD